MSEPAVPPIAGAPSADRVATLLRQLTADLSRVIDVEWAMSTILREGCELLGAAAGAAIVVDSGGTPSHVLSSSSDPAATSSYVHLLQTIRSAGSSGAGTGPQVLSPIPREWCDLADWPEGPPLVCLSFVLAQRGANHGEMAFFFHQPDQPDASTLLWSEVLAGLAAFALENARLFETALQQSSELGAFYETAMAIADEHDQPSMLQMIVERAAAVLGSRLAVIYLADESAQVLRVAARSGAVSDRPAVPLRYGEGLAGKAASTREAVVIRSSRGWASSEADAFGGGLRPRLAQMMALPVIWRRQLIGVLAIADSSRAQPFGQAEIRLAKLIAVQAANAVGIAQLMVAERTQRRIAEALEQGALAISREIHLDVVLERILDQVMQTFPCDAANIQTLNADQVIIVRSRGYEQFGLNEEQLRALAFVAGEHPDLVRLMAGEAVVVSDTLKEPAWVAKAGREWLRSWAGVPIRYADDVLGFLNLDSSKADAFDDMTPQRLVAFAAHAAAAIHNARLFQQLREEHRRLRLVYATGRGLAGSLEPHEILEKLIQGVLSATGGSQGAAFVLAPDSTPENPRLLRLALPGTTADGPYAPPIEEQALRTLRSGEPQFETDSSTYGARWVISFPLEAGGIVHGVGLAWIPASGERRDEWLDLLAAIGQEAGLALANAERHAQVQRRLAEMTLLQRIVAAIASRLDAESVIQELTQQLHTSLGFPSVGYYERHGNLLTLKQVAGPRPVVEQTTMERGIVGRVGRTGMAALVEDVRRDPDYLAGLVGTRAELAVPIHHGEEVLGVINIETSDPAQVDQGALELLQLLADQVSIALQNASLYEQVSKDVETLEARVRERTAQLEQAVLLARVAEQTKAQFVADVSHELRTPLTNIGLYLDLLEIGSQDHRDEYMTTLRREMTRLGGLIEQLLSISQLDAHQMEMKTEATDINSLIQVLVADRERMIKLKKLKLIVDARPDIPRVQADPQRIMQVLANLLTNASNYTPEGGEITLETGQRERDQRRWVIFSVSDTGPGIPPDERDRVFERFFRGIAGRASGTAGTGLGLPICKEIVDRHGGRIELASRPGQGTRVTVWLPVPYAGES
ncbi:MAG: GAF domain-containing protein [Actinobacteria bacterium]|nr:GAF domain-containing protein [Actinomycetota bacterium]